MWLLLFSQTQSKIELLSGKKVLAIKKYLPQSHCFSRRTDVLKLFASHWENGKENKNKNTNKKNTEIKTDVTILFAICFNRQMCTHLYSVL